MGSILKDMTVQAINKAAQNVPDSILHTAGLAAAGGCLLHLRSSPRVRTIVSGAIEATAVLTLASVAIGAMATLLTKHRLQWIESITGVSKLRTPRSTLYNKSRSSVISAIVEVVGRGISQNWKGAIAIIVMLLVSRAKDRRSRLRGS
jgi:putative Ca2+/H+ antiporter (TMEM165/GDT1 family)